MNLKPMLHSQAHCQVAPANATTKTCQRAYLPQRKKAQQVTMAHTAYRALL
jgi:hypothetical protein